MCNLLYTTAVSIHITQRRYEEALGKPLSDVGGEKGTYYPLVYARAAAAVRGCSFSIRDAQLSQAELQRLIPFAGKWVSSKCGLRWRELCC